MKLNLGVFITVLLLSGTLGADTLGFVQQKFTDLHFERGKWTRTVQLPCYSYVSQADGATVEVLRYGMGNLVPFKSKKGLTVSVCGSVAAFEEGFETGIPTAGGSGERQNH